MIRKLTNRRIPPGIQTVRVHSMAAGETCGGQETILLLSWRQAVWVARPAVSSKDKGPRI